VADLVVINKFDSTSSLYWVISYTTKVEKTK